MELGHNILTSHGYSTVVSRAVETGASIYQIFYRSPQSYNSFKRPDLETEEIAKQNKIHNKKIVVHGSYLINLCQDPQDYRHFKGLTILIEDLNESVKLGAIGVIIHMGNDTNKNGSLASKANFVSGIKEALKQSNKKSVLILETGAGVGNEVSSSLKELGEIRQSLSDSEKQRVKFCLDTCHMHANGCNFSSIGTVNVLSFDIDCYLGWKNVAVVHLNDSNDPCGAKKDNHADIGKGNINFEGLMHFVHLCVKHNVPMVLETPTHFYDGERFTHQQQMKLIREYHSLMYDNLGPNIQHTERTNGKVNLKKAIKSKK